MRHEAHNVAALALLLFVVGERFVREKRHCAFAAPLRSGRVSLRALSPVDLANVGVRAVARQRYDLRTLRTLRGP